MMAIPMTNESYMDICIPRDFKIEYEKVDNSTLIQLENYYKIHEITKKWHKNDYYSDIIILNGKNKKELSKDEWKVYFKKFANYYLKTKTIENEVIMKKVSLSVEKKFNELEYLLYLKELRIMNDKSKLMTLSYDERIKFNSLLQNIMHLTSKFLGLEIRIMNGSLPQNLPPKPIIFVISHVSKNDQIVLNEVVKSHYTILSGDYESLHNRIEGVITNLNGVIYFDMKSNEERKTIIPRVANALKSGDNILCSMEGAWNLSPNKMVNELFSGMILSANISNAIIVPIGIERFDNKLYAINISDRYFEPSKIDIKNEKELSDFKFEIWNELCSLKFSTYFDEQINEKISIKRSDIGDYETYKKNFEREVLADWTFKKEDIESKRYVSKNEPDVVYNFLRKKLNNLKKNIKLQHMDVYDNLVVSQLLEYRNLIQSGYLPSETCEYLNEELSKIFMENIHSIKR